MKTIKKRFHFIVHALLYSKSTTITVVRIFKIVFKLPNRNLKLHRTHIINIVVVDILICNFIDYLNSYIYSVKIIVYKLPLRSNLKKN